MRIHADPDSKQYLSTPLSQNGDLSQIPKQKNGSGSCVCWVVWRRPPSCGSSWPSHCDPCSLTVWLTVLNPGTRGPLGLLLLHPGTSRSPLGAEVLHPRPSCLSQALLASERKNKNVKLYYLTLSLFLYQHKAIPLLLFDTDTLCKVAQKRKNNKVYSTTKKDPKSIQNSY